MRILLLVLGVALVVVHATTVQAATAFSTFSVQVVVIGTCRVDAARLLPQLAGATAPQVCTQVGASTVVTLDRGSRTVLIEF
jgi:hypothetical protein